MLRTAHSKLIGYWNTDLGGVNEVVHIWEYGVLNSLIMLGMRGGERTIDPMY